MFLLLKSKTTNFLNQENKIQNVNLHNETVEKFQDAQKSKLKHFIFNLDDMWYNNMKYYSVLVFGMKKCNI